MISNAGLSIAAMHHSTGDKVCWSILLVHMCSDLYYSQQIEDWQSKNGYAHIKAFVSHLRLRNLTCNPNQRSLRGVAPALPFSDVVFRRYYDHALAYKDFKEASKSDDKHCLYLGLLGGPLYSEAVVYHYRERLLDQMEALCVALGKPLPFTDCEVGPLHSPVQSDPFEIEEVGCIYL